MLARPPLLAHHSKAQDDQRVLLQTLMKQRIERIQATCKKGQPCVYFANPSGKVRPCHHAHVLTNPIAGLRARPTVPALNAASISVSTLTCTLLPLLAHTGQGF